MTATPKLEDLTQALREGPYDKVFAALAAWEENCVLPEKSRLSSSMHDLSDQLDDMVDELQQDIDEAQRTIDRIVEFEKAWSKV